MSNVEKISIALPAEMIGQIQHAVKTGAYASTSEVIREALRDWKEKNEMKAAALKEFRRMVREGLESGPGRYASIDEIKAEARERFSALKRPA